MLVLEMHGGTLTQPVTNSDSHFLAWAPDGQSAYLKIDNINRPRILRVDINGTQHPLPIDDLTYDLAPAPLAHALLFTFSRGMGLGSEMWLGSGDRAGGRQMMVDPLNYMAFARWSPDGTQIAFIKIPELRDAVHDRRAVGDAGRRQLSPPARTGGCRAWLRARVVAGWDPDRVRAARESR